MADDGMTEQERAAYEAAQRLIAKTLAVRGTRISFDAEPFRALSRIPDEIARLYGLRSLTLSNTAIIDLTPISQLKGLQSLTLTKTGANNLTPISELSELKTLRINETGVIDLTPISKLNDLQRLSLTHTQVSDLTPILGLLSLRYLSLADSMVRDLRPLISLEGLGERSFGDLRFSKTPAVRIDKTLARLMLIENGKQRAKETLAYLKTLPPWPEPLPWLEETALPAKPARAPRKTPPRPSIRTPQRQIAFLLETASVTTMQAADLAKGIRLALLNVAVLPGTNRLPDALQSMLDLAEVLDRLAASNLTPAAPDREAELKARIAELEQTVATLTAALADQTKAKEAAEARANALETDKGFWTNYKSATGKALGYGQVAIMGTAIPAGIIYLLGPSHPFVRALLDLLTK